MSGPASRARPGFAGRGDPGGVGEAVGAALAGPPAARAGAASWRLVVIFMVMAVPQVLFSVPFAPEQLKTTDLLAMGCLALYAAIRARRTVIGLRDEALLLAFICWNMIAAFAGFLYMSAAGLADAGEIAELFARQIRFALIYAPALFAFAAPVDPRRMAGAGVRAMAIAVAATVWVALAYDAGSNAYDAHQSLIDETGRYIKRLGGLPGETGAFSFNSLVTYQLLIFFLALAGRRRAAAAVLLLFPLFSAFVFYHCQARIGLLIGALYFALAVGLTGLVPRRALLWLCAGLAAFALAAGTGIVDVGVDRRFALRLALLFTAESDLGSMTSGRIEHWSAALDLWTLNPLIGFGHQNAIFLLGHTVENLPLQSLTEYGVVGTAMLLLLLARLGLPLFDPRSRDRAANMALAATAISTLAQWQVNDINTFNQTYPVLVMVMVLQYRRVRAEGAARAEAEAERPG